MIVSIYMLKRTFSKGLVSILNVLITDNGHSHTQKKINDFFV